MWKLDQNISSKLDGLFDDRPFGQALAVGAAKYLLTAFFGLVVVIYPWVNDSAEGALPYDLLFIAAIVVPQVLTIALSFLIGRKRPYERLPDMWHMPIRLYTPSFPSGHATMAFATATFLLWYWHPVIWLALGTYAIAALIAIARVVVGVHYVTDVIAGAMMGAGLSWLTVTMLERLFLALH